ncbi:MAG: DUF4743 domain-containing protein [Kiloniellales bacterium]
MSLLDRVRACHGWDPEAYRPFLVAGRPVGRVRHEFTERLADFGRTFAVENGAVSLDPALGSFEERSAALAEVLARLRAEGGVPGWRGEPYPVVRSWGETPLMQIERAAVPLFGVRGFGVHLNGFVETPNGLEMWIGKRAMSKPTGPGKLDHLAAGGQPHGLGIRENMIKECQEEAGMAPKLAARVVPVGTVSYRCARREGLRDDVLFCFDLEVPPDFEPRNTDGEVEAFYRWPIARVIETLKEGDAFKFNVALVIIDFLVRRGLLDPDDPDYSAIVEGLRLGR